MLYFAYGSNMLHKRIQARVPSAQPLGVYVLQGHDLRFHKVSKDGSGKADAFFTGKSNDFVFGVLYKISRCHKYRLDNAEGRPFHYQMKWVKVYDKQGNWVKAFTYYAVIINQTYVPFDSYKNIVVAGAKQNKLPSYYVKCLKAVKSKKDPIVEESDVAFRALSFIKR